ncbi:MAG: hypothetical protein ACYS8Z_05990 [Planctomycetota bacterium]|jgi:hypothetical protein
MSIKKSATLLALLGILSCTGCASKKFCKQYFSYGGLTTGCLKQHVGKGWRYDPGTFDKPEAAFLSKNGNVYVKTYGKLESDDTNATYILKLPVRKHAEAVRRFYNEHNRMSGMLTLRLSRSQIHRGATWWDRARKNQVKELPVESVENKKEILSLTRTQQIVFEPSSDFAYEQGTPIYGEDGHWIWFKATTKTNSRWWLRLFIPFTYAFDVITSPIQIPICYATRE